MRAKIVPSVHHLVLLAKIIIFIYLCSFTSALLPLSEVALSPRPGLDVFAGLVPCPRDWPICLRARHSFHKATMTFPSKLALSQQARLPPLFSCSIVVLGLPALCLSQRPTISRPILRAYLSWQGSFHLDRPNQPTPSSPIHIPQPLPVVNSLVTPEPGSCLAYTRPRAISPLSFVTFKNSFYPSIDKARSGIYSASLSLARKARYPNPNIQRTMPEADG
jgi:hypothetical protein